MPTIRTEHENIGQNKMLCIKIQKKSSFQFHSSGTNPGQQLMSYLNGLVAKSLPKLASKELQMAMVG
jgi:hypothetical protein